MMSAISRIPPEVFSVVLDHLPTKALPLLRTVSKIFLDQINVRLFSEINLMINSLEYSDKDLRLLKSFSTSSSPITSSFLKTIRTVILSTGRKCQEDVDCLFMSGETHEHILTEIVEDEAVEDSLSEDLPLFLSRLENLETIE